MLPESPCDVGRGAPSSSECCQQVAVSGHTPSGTALRQRATLRGHNLCGGPPLMNPTASSGAGPMDTPSQTVHVRKSISGHAPEHSKREATRGREAVVAVPPPSKVLCDQLAGGFSSRGGRGSCVLRFTTWSKDVEGLEPLRTVAGHVKWCSCYRKKEYGGSQKN